jgi:hypothetical protein
MFLFLCTKLRFSKSFLEGEILGSAVAPVVVVILCISFCAMPAPTVTNQNLYWGFDIGQRFNYAYHLEEVNGTEILQLKNVSFYIIVESIPAINDSISSPSELLNYPEYGCYFSNGTEITYLPYLWQAYPIGNWSMIIDFLWKPGALTEDEIIDTPTLAGYNITSASDDSVISSSEVYLKSTGALYTRQYIFQHIRNNILFRVETRVDLIEPTTSISPISIGVLIAGGAAIVIVVGVVMVKRMKS